MKKQFLAGALCSFLLLTAAGCGHQPEIPVSTETSAETAAATEPAQEEVEKETEKQDSYEKLITAVRECIVNKAIQIPEGYDFSIALLTSGSYGTSGYLIEDIDGNGTDELIFGANGDEPNEIWDGIVYDIYTISDGTLIHVLDGWERNRYYFCENGMIANEGSSGAANFSYSYFTFEENELRLAESVIYDGMKDAQNPWFYSTVSEFDTENAEPISEERAEEIREKYVYEYPEFIPFAENH